MSLFLVETPMKDHTTRPHADFIDLLTRAMTGMFPGLALEALIDRLEVRK